jgi:hypothetical protein
MIICSNGRYAVCRPGLGLFSGIIISTRRIVGDDMNGSRG